MVYPDDLLPEIYSKEYYWIYGAVLAEATVFLYLSSNFLYKGTSLKFPLKCIWELGFPLVEIWEGSHLVACREPYHWAVVEAT